jgi:2-keto-4-pentenoate hydratase/2-oxohepta-3-ene-1,7-dioic acid hydratase in catechol pathway
MKIARFNEGRIGIVRGERVHDVTAAAGIDPGEWPPVGMNRLIANFAARRGALEAAAQGVGIPLGDVKLLTPVPWPNKVLAYPVNYHAHGVEMKSSHRANLNGFFLKSSGSVSGPSDPIVLPDLPSREVHHEAELAIVIGRTARHVPLERAMECVFGYACLLDITVRGNEERVMRKSFDTFCPVGPWIVTADEVPDPAALQMKLWVNDALKQDANTRDLIVDIPTMIATAASVTTLQPGDLIATGTPAGVGPIRAGDTVTIEIPGVGRMSVAVVQGEGGYNVALKKEAKP